MTKQPHLSSLPPLIESDTVAIVCPAGKISGSLIDAVNLLEGWGLKVRLGKSVEASYHQFAGDDALRAADFQQMLDDPEVKAIFAARGGYGTVRIIDRIDFSRFSKAPKWIVGFSDITVLHSHIQAVWGIPSIHGQMPLTIPDATAPSLDSLRKALFGERLTYHYPAIPGNRPGKASGVLIGGNLSLLVNVSGSASDPNYQGKILFLEDVSEYFYSIDRMLWTLKRAGKLAGLQGLLVGGFTHLKDNETPFGYTVHEMIREKVEAYGYPVAFDFPAGHLSNNHALILGARVQMEVTEEAVVIKFEPTAII
ncbi:muramoyltetrapeptide carboxypeptidase [bacterium A37T11]|nr:muramoyltetrapeptide carboxypeptidase [bacterium A37T11]